jgi:hypothetical protein
VFEDRQLWRVEISWITVKGGPRDPGGKFSAAARGFAGRMPTWGQPMGGPSAPWAVPSPDGRHPAIYEWSLNANMWMMENF